MPLSRSPLSRGKSRMKRGQMDRGKFVRLRRVRVNKHGKKARASARANRILKAECVRLNIYRCELGYENCTGDNFLSFAHVAKRRELLPGELETGAILACWNCHRRLDEGMSHAEMRRVVTEVLERRAA